MAASEGPPEEDFDSTDGWRITLLFVVIILLSIMVEHSIHWADHQLAHRSKGLRDCFHHLQQEVMLVGLISLVLSATQEHLLKLCVEDDDYHSSSPYSSSPYDSGPSYDNGGAYGNENSHDSTYPYPPPATDDHHRRFLLGVSKAAENLVRVTVGRSLLGGGAVTDSCAAGDKPFWSALLIHQVHIFIFTMGCSYIMYALVTSAITIGKVLRWNEWEQESCHTQDDAKHLTAVDEEMPDITALYNFRVIYSMFTTQTHLQEGRVPILGAFVSQFHTSVSPPMYLALRRLFILKHRLPATFQFYKYISESLEEDLARVISLDWKLWLIVAVYLGVNEQIPSLDLIWVLSGLAMINSIVVATRLEWIVAQLTIVGFKYNEAFLIIRDKDRKKLAATVVDSLMKVDEEEEAEEEADVKLDPEAEPLTGEEAVKARWRKALTPKQIKSINTAKRQELSEETKRKKRKKKAKDLRRHQRASAVIQDSLMEDTDASDHLFWFSSPTFMLFLIRLTMLESALTIALCWFIWWQELEHIDNLWIIVLLSVVSLVHTGLFCLPVYTLAVSTSSHHNKRALLQAHKAKENPVVAEVAAFNSVFSGLLTKLEALHTNEKRHQVKSIVGKFHHHFEEILKNKKELLVEVMQKVDELKMNGIDMDNVQEVLIENKTVHKYMREILDSDKICMETKRSVNDLMGMNVDLPNLDQSMAGTERSALSDSSIPSSVAPVPRALDNSSAWQKLLAKPSVKFTKQGSWISRIFSMFTGKKIEPQSQTSFGTWSNGGNNEVATNGEA